MAQNPVVTITMEHGGVMKAELYPEMAPNTVNNFISLVKKGFYDGLIFHRVIAGFMIQGGDPEGTGMGGPGYSIPPQPFSAEYPEAYAGCPVDGEIDEPEFSRIAVLYHARRRPASRR